MRLAILDCGSGNLLSVARACWRASGVEGEISANPEIVARADALILPGVGAFAACKKALAAKDGLLEALQEQVCKKGKPFLGICVGMQLLASHGVEYETIAGFDWIKGKTRPLVPAAGRPVPHMGWNRLNFSRRHGLGEGLDKSHVYFAHSYIFVPNNDDAVLASCSYGEAFAAFVVRDNIAGVQFHPEKSSAVGEHLLAQFCRWHP